VNRIRTGFRAFGVVAVSIPLASRPGGEFHPGLFEGTYQRRAKRRPDWHCGLLCSHSSEQRSFEVRGGKKLILMWRNGEFRQSE
jgi:hypothetical protein